MHSNAPLQLATDFVHQTRQSLFLTGKAGTGKTTFLHHIKHNTPKRLIVTAPTGVAAINAGGVTLHSFFQLSFGPYVPGSTEHSASQEFNREKIKLIKCLDLLIIDEISMVRADVLDAVDEVLRRYRHPDKPFGGVQLLMIGDLHQLAPVVKQDDWALLKPHYDSCYFFSSHALRRVSVACLELTYIYRQTDQHFIRLLNQIRENCLSPEALADLNTRVNSTFASSEEQNYITLTTHNKTADELNQKQLTALSDTPRCYSAVIEREYPEHAYPTDPELLLKKGAQVMFIRNDIPPTPKFYNGKIGVITALGRDRIRIQCPDDEEPITLETVTWENIQYHLDEKKQQVTQEVVGSFTQFPLRLAWAITIHKSQGLTFDRAIIDAHAAFAHGQVYVALSRCRSLEGMVLTQPIPASAIKTDSKVTRFVQRYHQQPATQTQLQQAKIQTQQQMLYECFGFEGIQYHLTHLMNILSEPADFGVPGTADVLSQQAIEHIYQQTQNHILIVSEKFLLQLRTAFRADQLPEEDAYVQERTQKAALYFTEQLQSGLADWIANSLILVTEHMQQTGGKRHKKRIRHALENLQQSMTLKLACLAVCRDTFSSEAYGRAMSSIELTT